MEKVTTVAIDLAKNVFSLHGVEADGKTVLRRTVRRDQLEALVAKAGGVRDRDGGVLRGA